MNFISRAVLAIVIGITLIFPASGYGYYVWSPAEGKFVSAEGASGKAEKTPEEYYKTATQLRDEGKTEDTISELRNLVRAYPLSSYAPEAQFMIASIFEGEGKYDRATQEFQKLVKDFPQSNQVDQAIEHLFQIGTYFITGEKKKVIGIPLLPTLPQAIAVFSFIIEHAPYGAYGDQAQFQLGVVHRKAGHFQDAVSAFQKLIDDYPQSTLIDDAHYQLAEASYELSQIAARDQQSRDSASDQLRQFLDQYRSGSLAERAQILKQQLDEQDAEKNYRIALYYEKQGFSESAMIYYEDVASRYPQTSFGAKAQARYQAIQKPGQMAAQGEEAIAKRLAEVHSLLEALETESKRKDLDQTRISEVAGLKKDLEAERTSLELAQHKFQHDTKGQFDLRKKSLRSREKTLRQKFKTFQKRQKSMAKHTSPELAEVFEKWNASLVREENELREERERIGAAGVTFEKEKKGMFSFMSGMPSFRLWPERTPPAEKIVQFKEKKWTEIHNSRLQLTQGRKDAEKEIAQLSVELTGLEQKEFNAARQTAHFQETLPGPLLTQAETLNHQKKELNGRASAFEAAKKDFIAQYGSEALESLSAMQGSSSAELPIFPDISSAEAALKPLQAEKAALSQAWLLQKDQVDALAKTVHTKLPAGPSAEAAGSDQTAAAADQQSSEARMLRKRMKYVEREIRRRLDQIEDWEFNNERRTEQLDALLHPKISRTSAGKVEQAVTAPVKGFYKLTHAFLFGLPNRTKELNEEALKRVQTGEVSHTAQEVKEIAELRDEIELQNILIQGRAKEITELKAQLDQLHAESAKYPNFEYQSLLIDRFPTALEHSVLSARSVFEGQDLQAITTDRLAQEEKRLNELEQKLNGIDGQIKAISAQIEAEQARAQAEENAKQKIQQDAASVESVKESEAPSAADIAAEKKAKESELVRLKSEWDQFRRNHEKESQAFEEGLKNWYLSNAEIRQKISSSFNDEGKQLLVHIEEVKRKQAEIQAALEHAAQKELKALSLEQKFLAAKKKVLEKRLAGLKDPASETATVLQKAIQGVAGLNEQANTEIVYLNHSFQR